MKKRINRRRTVKRGAGFRSRIKRILTRRSKRPPATFIPVAEETQVPESPVLNLEDEKYDIPRRFGYEENRRINKRHYDIWEEAIIRIQQKKGIHIKCPAKIRPDAIVTVIDKCAAYLVAKDENTAVIFFNDDINDEEFIRYCKYENSDRSFMLQNLMSNVEYQYKYITKSYESYKNKIVIFLSDYLPLDENNNIRLDSTGEILMFIDSEYFSDNGNIYSYKNPEDIQKNIEILLA